MTELTTLTVDVLSDARHGLKLIDQIPADRPLRLEGKNGIGKSVTIRLLALVSGEQPYKNEIEAWGSLAKSVGDTQISIGGLAGDASTVTVTFTPTLWPTTPDMPGDWLGRFEVDGRASTANEVASMIDIVHLLGTERLNQNLDHQRGLLGAAIGELLAHLDEREDSTADIGELATRLLEVSPTTAAAEADEHRHLRETLADGQPSFTIAKEKARDLAQATTYAAMLDGGQIDEQAQEIERVREDFGLAASELADAEAELDRVLDKLSRGGAAEKKVEALQRRLDRETRKRQTAHNTLLEMDERLRSIGVDPARPNADDSRLLKEARSAAELKLKMLRQKALHSSRSESENDLFTGLRVVLERAADEGLGERVLAIINGTVVTVSQMLRDLNNAEDVQDDPSEEIDATTRTVGSLGKAIAAITDREAAEKSHATAEKELEKLSEDIQGLAELKSEANGVRDRRDRAADTESELGRRLGSLRESVLGEGDVDAFERSLTDLLAKHGLHRGTLAEASAEASDVAFAAERDRNEQKNRLANLERSRASRTVDRARLAEKIKNEPTLAWLKDAADKRGHGDPLSWTEQAWEWATSAVGTYAERLVELGRTSRALKNAADNPGMSGSGNAAEVAIAQAVEARTKSMLSSPAIRASLFGGGEVQRVSFVDRSVTWSVEGVERTRPLSAFSSGQQAFGYVRAQLEELRGHSSNNRMVFLDEFGAFIAADQRKPLSELLNRELSQDLADEVVVVLPLQADYVAELSQTTGKLRDRYEERARQIEAHGYFTERFET